MYLTIFKKKKDIITFEQILQNPFAHLENFKSNPKKITLEITEEYGKRLYEKHSIIYPETHEYLSFIPHDEIPQHYRHCRIPKKSNPNKLRDLDIPDSHLKNLQSFYKRFIEYDLHVQAHDAAYAYVQHRSIVQANEKHQSNESKWFLQIDLKDFFPSINEDFLRRMLLQVYPFKFLPEETFNNIIKYALYNDSIPQGSPLSPTITNLLMVPIDYAIKERLHNYNKKHYVYTRYADDIKISCKYDFNPNEIVRIIKDIFKEHDAPLKINNEKTRYGSIAGKNYYLGLILNKDNKISPGWRNNKKFRAMLHQFCTKQLTQPEQIYKMLGIISYYKSVEPDFVKKTIQKYNNLYNINLIEEAKNIIR